MDVAKATALLQLPLYRLDGLLDGEKRDDLKAEKVLAEVPSTGLSVVELAGGRVAALWQIHGSLHNDLKSLLEPNRHSELDRAKLGLPDPVLNSFEADRVRLKTE